MNLRATSKTVWILVGCWILLSWNLAVPSVNGSESTPTVTPTQRGKIAYLTGDRQSAFAELLTVLDTDGKNLRTFLDACGEGAWSWSPDGIYLAYFAVSVKSSGSCLDGNGKPLKLHLFNVKDGSSKLLDNAESLFPSRLFWSSDGQQLAYIAGMKTGTELFVINLDGSGLRQLTNDGLDNKQSFRAAWSPDGRRLAYIADADFGAAIYIINGDGSDLHRLTNVFVAELASDTLFWMDNTHIVFDAYQHNGINGKSNIYSVSDNGKVNKISPNEGDDSALNPSLSPDGRHIAFILDSQNRFSLCIIDIDGGNQHCLDTVSQKLVLYFHHGECNYHPSWSPDSQNLCSRQLS